MKNKIILTAVVLIILAVIISLGVKIYLDKDLEKEKQELQETYEKYGAVEKETVNTIIAKFNAEIMDTGLNTPAYDDYLTIENNAYWFGLTDDISYYLQPVSFTGDKEKDILEMSAIYFKKSSYNEETANKYVKNLIRANNNDLTDEEIANLIKESEELSSLQKNSNNGKGISVGYSENADHYIYQVIRLYK